MWHRRVIGLAQRLLPYPPGGSSTDPMYRHGAYEARIRTASSLRNLVVDLVSSAFLVYFRLDDILSLIFLSFLIVHEPNVVSYTSARGFKQQMGHLED